MTIYSGPNILPSRSLRWPGQRSGPLFNVRKTCARRPSFLRSQCVIILVFRVERTDRPLQIHSSSESAKEFAPNYASRISWPSYMLGLKTYAYGANLGRVVLSSSENEENGAILELQEGNAAPTQLGKCIRVSWHITQFFVSYARSRRRPGCLRATYVQRVRVC